MVLTTCVSCCGFEETKNLADTDSEKIVSRPESFEDFLKNERNLHVLSLLNSEPNLEVTFQGLKRKLGWHQEILSRTLRRLVRDEAIIRTDSGGYKLNTDNKIGYLHKPVKRQDSVTPITYLWLPQDLSLVEVTSRLKNTWFGAWRWYSYSKNNSQRILTWISEDGCLWVNLRIMGSTILIESGPAESVGRDRCIHAGYELLSHIMKFFKSRLAEPEIILQPN